ncbi:MAG: hypothetical protein LBG65_05430 [Puniceicoccales bacterium]|nr:hypothetical protein [Puniceicoccales bacterium]
MRIPLRFITTPVLASALFFGACATRREAFDKAFEAGRLEKAENISQTAITKSRPDALEWLLRAADSAHFAGKLNDAVATYARACELFHLRDSENQALMRDPARMEASLLKNSGENSYFARTYERIFAETRRGEALLESGDPRAARKAFAAAEAWRENAMKRIPLETSGRSRALDALLARDAPAAGDHAPYFAATRFCEQYVKDPAFDAYGSHANPYSTYISAIVALLDGDAASAEAGLKAAAVMLQRNQQVINEANWFGPSPKHPEAANRVWVIIENGLQPRLREVRVESRQDLPTPTGTISTKLHLALPVLEVIDSPYTGFRVNSSGRKEPLYSEVLANVDAIARAEYNQALPDLTKHETVRALIRASASASPNTTAPKVPFPAANTRQWSTLPKNIHLLTFNMPADRTFTLSSTHGARSLPVTIPPCKNAIILFRVPGTLSDAPPPRVLTFN